MCAYRGRGEVYACLQGEERCMCAYRERRGVCVLTGREEVCVCVLTGEERCMRAYRRCVCVCLQGEGVGVPVNTPLLVLIEDLQQFNLKKVVNTVSLLVC